MKYDDLECQQTEPAHQTLVSSKSVSFEDKWSSASETTTLGMIMFYKV